MKKVISLILAIMLIGVFVLFALGSGEETTNEVVGDDTIVSDEKIDSNSVKDDDSDKKSNDVESTDSKLTMGQKNALRSAETYLNTMAFSREGLIEQLEFEGYSNEEAVFAVDNCGADWKEQAVKSAKTYLDTMSFSREGLIDQLEFEGFTHEQAVYGVEQNGY